MNTHRWWLDRYLFFVIERTSERNYTACRTGSVRRSFYTFDHFRAWWFRINKWLVWMFLIWNVNRPESDSCFGFLIGLRGEDTRICTPGFTMDEKWNKNESPYIERKSEREVYTIDRIKSNHCSEIVSSHTIAHYILFSIQNTQYTITHSQDFESIVSTM